MTAEQVKEYISENYTTKYEREYAEKLIYAIKIGDKETIDQFNKFGNTPRKILDNFHAYEVGLKFGFTKIIFNEHGWLKNREWKDIERINIDINCNTSNHIYIGKGLNDKCTLGVSYSVGIAGGGYYLNEYMHCFTNKQDAIMYGLSYILEVQEKTENKYKDDSCGNYKKDFSKKVIKTIKELIKTFKEPKIKQLELFSE